MESENNNKKYFSIENFKILFYSILSFFVLFFNTLLFPMKKEEENNPGTYIYKNIFNLISNRK